jgi:hypothetical protein
VLGSIGIDRAEFLGDCCRFWFRESLTAFLAELHPKMVCPTATCAGNFKPRPTILAEDGIGGILSPALGAVHNITNLHLRVSSFWDERRDAEPSNPF